MYKVAEEVHKTCILTTQCNIKTQFSAQDTHAQKATMKLFKTWQNFCYYDRCNYSTSNRQASRLPFKVLTGLTLIHILLCLVTVLLSAGYPAFIP